MVKRLVLSALIFGFTVSVSNAQDDLLDLIEKEDNEKNKDKRDYASAAFKTNLAVTSQSIENVASGVLSFRISHRFGTISDGLYDLFGLDNSDIRFAFDYGINDWLQVGVGRSSFEKLYDGNLKAKILRQQKGKQNIPISIVYYTSAAVNTLKWADPNRENFPSARWTYCHQLLIGRKFSESFSAQISPTLIHRNLVPTAADANDVFAMGAALRQKLTKRLAVNIEYFHRLDTYNEKQFKNPLSFCFDIETGGHVFQLIFSNARSMVEKGLITETSGDIGQGDIYFGFNLSRVFTVVDKTKKM